MLRQQQLQGLYKGTESTSVSRRNIDTTGRLAAIERDSSAP